MRQKTTRICSIVNKELVPSQQVMKHVPSIITQLPLKTTLLFTRRDPGPTERSGKSTVEKANARSPIRAAQNAGWIWKKKRAECGEGHQVSSTKHGTRESRRTTRMLRTPRRSSLFRPAWPQPHRGRDSPRAHRYCHHRLCPRASWTHPPCHRWHASCRSL